MNEKDKVIALEGPAKGKKNLRIELINENGIWLSQCGRTRFKGFYGPYEEHQLKKVGAPPQQESATIQPSLFET